MALVTVTEASRLAGVSRRTLSRKVQLLEAYGAAQLVGGVWFFESDGLLEAINGVTQQVHPSNAERMMPTAQRPQAGGPEEPAEEYIPPWAESKARREFYAAEKAKRELELLEGKLLVADDANRWLFESERRIRNQIQGIPARCSADLAAETDQVRIEIMLDKAIYDCLTDLAKAFPDVL